MTRHKITPRKVAFDWSKTRPQWIEGEAFISHLTNSTHILLPIVEVWFCQVFKEALPHVTDDKVREDVIAFMRQEAIHGAAHKPLIEHFLQHGMDIRDGAARTQRMIDRLLGDPARIFGLLPTGRRLARWWLGTRVGIIAAGEHFTCILGRFILENEELPRLDADPAMMELLRWHGAEEVEHRSVAFDLYKHLTGAPLANRLLVMGFIIPFLTWYWIESTRYLMRQDPALAIKPGFFAEWRRASSRNLIPSARDLLGGSWRFLMPGYDPEKEADTDIALAHLAKSPAVR
ncbi:metal-dependent hydrolase [Zavarzinia aquatilis]|uniref:Metal-dependent hydrolase n=1 Tax=Zavarzinia aquatilis TaxID=2211142 RepID=A0A317EES0_9PROT|nr:metal-dependent hydrolase [Zavarzinia aquatilis]PWR24610.1 metal-dependent hydrolase [Zavarzinia aquatilis]